MYILTSGSKERRSASLGWRLIDFGEDGCHVPLNLATSTFWTRAEAQALRPRFQAAKRCVAAERPEDSSERGTKPEISRLSLPGRLFKPPPREKSGTARRLAASQGARKRSDGHSAAPSLVSAA